MHDVLKNNDLFTDRIFCIIFSKEDEDFLKWFRDNKLW